ncbi:S-locus lectin protein kinase family protein [Prunus dulcis]|uniref:S-locus lectin protein kinase family protein n=1 Tax=Prunus dulcis TaxID=3755 RepID=A0A4Y1QV24_PRUDU|nr:S-locus lectin protein kinase family protein [Prunus dulcis]
MDESAYSSHVPIAPLQAHSEPKSFSKSSSSSRSLWCFFAFGSSPASYCLIFLAGWHGLVAFASEAEARTNAYPSHLWQAIVAYEDRRFFSHFGIDLVGIARAVVSFSALGGGSTITQQIYWGHGIYGVESASTFYFGKHPSCLSLGESAMLAGLIPAPELRSPLRDPSRGKTFQARVLKRMVDVGFLDFETALFVVKQYLPLHVTESEAPVVFLPGVGTNSKLRDIWDWETESKIWEACEDMERWALKVRDGASAKRSCSQY